MKEEVITLPAQHKAAGEPCAQCQQPLVAGDRAVICPRCRTPHHLACWIQRGGCARRGCRQVVDPSLLPPKVEEPIKRSTVSPLIILATVVALVAGGLWLFFNAKGALERRGTTIAVMVPSLEDEAAWLEIVSDYNESPVAEKPIELLYTPYGPAGSAYEQKLVVMVAAGDSPEVVLLEPDRFQVYAEQQMLMELDELIAKLDALGLSPEPSRLATVTIDGAVLGLPHPAREAVFVVPKVSLNPEVGQEALLELYRSLATRYAGIRR